MRALYLLTRGRYDGRHYVLQKGYDNVFDHARQARACSDTDLYVFGTFLAPFLHANVLELPLLYAKEF